MSKPIFRGWLVVAACFLCMLISGGVGWFTFPVFMPPIEEEFGWTDLELGLAVALWAAVGAAFSPVAGRIVDRFGSRWIMLGGVAGGGLATLALAEIRSLSHLYGVFFVAAISTGAATYVPVAGAISRWFVKRRGFVMPNVSSLLIQSLGWRWTYRIFGIAPMLDGGRPTRGQAGPQGGSSKVRGGVLGVRGRGSRPDLGGPRRPGLNRTGRSADSVIGPCRPVG